MYYGDFKDPFMRSEYCLVQSTALRRQIGLPLLPNLRQIPLLITPHQTLISSLQLPHCLQRPEGMVHRRPPGDSMEIHYPKMPSQCPEC